MSEQYKMVAENPQSTVVSDFEPVYRKSTQYQSEAELEHDFISQLEKQGYEYLLEKPLNFDPFGHAELSLLAKIVLPTCFTYNYSFFV